MTVVAYKFLGPGAVGRFSRFRWPAPAGDAPGAWIETSAIRPCREGVHACTIDQLARWLDRELWTVELDGEVVSTREQVIATRGRLLARVDAWDDDARAALAAAAVERARTLAAHASGADAATAAAYLADATTLAPLDVPAALYCAAHVALTLDGYSDERRWQSRWLAARCGLVAA